MVGGGREIAVSLVQTNDGGYAIIGYTTSFGGHDFWLVKTDADGNMQWNKAYDKAADIAYSVIQTKDGGYAIGGFTGVSPDQDFWLVRTDEFGNGLWNKTYAGPGDDYAFSMILTKDEGYALAGRTNAFDANGKDVYFVKTDANGNVQWSKTYGGSLDEQAYCVVQTDDDGYIIAGITDSSWPSSGDAWLIKTNTYGNMQWNRTYGESGWDAAWAVCLTKDGGYAIACETESTGSSDVWLIKTDANGEPSPSLKYGLAWIDSTPNTITLCRGIADTYWNYVRARIWTIKDTP